ncbi:MAG: hypothetical protein ACK5O7_02370 [Holosporales bacterium]
MRRFSPWFVILLAGCQNVPSKPMEYPDQGGLKKGPGLLSRHDDGFVITDEDLSGTKE